MRPRASVIALGIVACAVAVAAFAGKPLVAARAKGLFEATLSARTGMTWTVADGLDIGFDPAPHLLLHGIVAQGQGAPAIALREVRLTCDLGCLFGRARHVHAVAEGLSVTAPLDRGSPAGAVDHPATAAAEGDGIAALRIRVDGLEARLDDAQHVLQASAGTVDVDLDLGAATGGRQVTIDLGAADYTASATLTRAPDGTAQPAADALRVAVTSRAAQAAWFVADGTAAFTPHGLRLAVTDGKVDGAPFTGTAALDMTSRPTVALDIRLSRLAITAPDHVEAARQADAGPVVDSESLLAIDPQWLAGFDGTASAEIADLRVETVGLHDIRTALTLADRMLDVDVASGALYDGTARARYVLAPGDGGAARHQLSLSLNHARLALLLGDLTTIRGVDGTADLRVDMQAAGRRAEAVLRSATGRATLSATDGSIAGLDLAGLTLPDPDSPDPGGKPFFTEFSRLGGSFDIADGRATTTDILLRSNLAVVNGDGLVDLIGRTLDLRLQSRLLSRNGEEGGLTVPLHIAGPWSQPAVSADLAAVAAHPDQALKSLQDLGGTLFGREDGGLGSLFDALGPQPDAKPRKR